MATRSTKRPAQLPRRPEKKFGPYHNGLGIAIWLNEVQTEQGPRYFRSITIAPRRYRDADDGQWKDAKSFRPVDLATLTLALDAARQYCATTPLPGKPPEGDEANELHIPDDGEVPSEPAAT